MMTLVTKGTVKVVTEPRMQKQMSNNIEYHDKFQNTKMLPNSSICHPFLQHTVTSEVTGDVY